ncbi:MAG: hypothetical protein NPINA01_17860 [Nitrospinaceae bacterium]|nr:MAG: hypothetical protein NPINA01_17860 [Nitrospinaceae bacterium]
MKWLKGKKTYLVAGLMAAVTLLQLITGETTLQEFIMSEHVVTLMEALGLSTLRAGIAKRVG